jgi:protein-tyrosine kinase
VSLIESALAKLRRAGEGAAPASAVPHTAAATPARTSSTVIAPLPEIREPSKHISIDLESLRAAGYLPAEELERRFVDHYRQIKRPLIEKALPGSADMRLIMVTSALPGDGKTFTSLNLALNLARERDGSVLLVDADIPKARISHLLRVRAEPGFLDALFDQTLDVESQVIGTDVRGLQVLPAGKFHESASELLASSRMAQIAARLVATNPRRLVVFDSAPLLVSSEARSLIRVPGQIVLVVRSGLTPVRAVADAVALLDRSKLQGLILNHAPLRHRGLYFYGYYGYGEQGARPPEERDGRNSAAL